MSSPKRRRISPTVGSPMTPGQHLISSTASSPSAPFPHIDRAHHSFRQDVARSALMYCARPPVPDPSERQVLEFIHTYVPMPSHRIRRARRLPALPTPSQPRSARPQLVLGPPATPSSRQMLLEFRPPSVLHSSTPSSAVASPARLGLLPTAPQREAPDVRLDALLQRMTLPQLNTLYETHLGSPSRFKYGKDALAILFSQIFLRSSLDSNPLLRRRSERARLRDLDQMRLFVRSHLHFHLSGHRLPTELVIVHILPYLSRSFSKILVDGYAPATDRQISAYSPLFGLGRVSRAWRSAVLGCWEGMLRVRKDNLFLVPTMVFWSANLVSVGGGMIPEPVFSGPRLRNSEKMKLLRSSSSSDQQQQQSSSSSNSNSNSSLSASSRRQFEMDRIGLNAAEWGYLLRTVDMEDESLCPVSTTISAQKLRGLVGLKLLYHREKLLKTAFSALRSHHLQLIRGRRKRLLSLRTIEFLKIQQYWWVEDAFTEIRIKDFAPNCEAVKYPPVLSLCFGLENLRTLYFDVHVTMVPPDTVIWSLCLNHLEHLPTSIENVEVECRTVISAPLKPLVVWIHSLQKCRQLRLKGSAGFWAGCQLPPDLSDLQICSLHLLYSNTRSGVNSGGFHVELFTAIKLRRLVLNGCDLATCQTGASCPSLEVFWCRVLSPIEESEQESLRPILFSCLSRSRSTITDEYLSIKVNVTASGKYRCYLGLLSSLKTSPFFPALMSLFLERSWLSRFSSVRFERPFGEGETLFGPMSNCPGFRLVSDRMVKVSVIQKKAIARFEIV